MRVKDQTVETEFHPKLTAFLFRADIVYDLWGSEAIITAGSENDQNHSRKSLHYADPGQAADLRIWAIARVPEPPEQRDALRKAADQYCDDLNIPRNWIDIILKPSHIHIEYQPKRRD